MTAMWAVRDLATAAFSAVVCAGLIVLLRPALRRYALARPNARSSHQEPTPQGGGIAVHCRDDRCHLSWRVRPRLRSIAPPPATFSAAIVLIACVGAADDIRPLAVIPRLLLQALAIAAVIYALPDELRPLPALPWWLERVVLFLAGLWFVNLVNFMDGIDWMTVAEVVPIAGGTRRDRLSWRAAA